MCVIFVIQIFLKNCAQNSSLQDSSSPSLTPQRSRDSFSTAVTKHSLTPQRSRGSFSIAVTKQPLPVLDIYMAAPNKYPVIAMSSQLPLYCTALPSTKCSIREAAHFQSVSFTVCFLIAPTRVIFWNRKQEILLVWPNLVGSCSVAVSNDNVRNGSLL